MRASYTTPGAPVDLAGIQSARVHLVLPKRELFNREKREPSASIVVKVRGELDAGQIKAIQHLAASAVDGLKPSRVSIVDEAGQLLASGAGEQGPEDGETEQVAADRRGHGSHRSTSSRWRGEGGPGPQGSGGQAREAFDLTKAWLSDDIDYFGLILEGRLRAGLAHGQRQLKTRPLGPVP